MSDEQSVGRSVSWSLDSSSPESPVGIPQVAPRRAVLPPGVLGCMAIIQEELRLVTEALPAGIAASALCHALAYILQTKWHWQVKFCCQSKDAQLPHTMPRHWVEDIMLIMPQERMHFVVDLRFQEKFDVRCLGPAGERFTNEVLQSIPAVYVGTLGELFRDIDLWTAALEQAFLASPCTLPPWRTRRTFQQLYKYCVEHDATESSMCLRTIGACLATGHVEQGGCQCTFMASMDSWELLTLDFLRSTLSQPQSPDVGAFAFPEAWTPDDLDYDFDKEESVGDSFDSQGSGLSYLLQGH